MENSVARHAIDELADWVRQVNWRFFCTLTFGRPFSDRQAEAVYATFIDRLERSLHCEVCFVRGDEKRFSGCGMPASGRHFHALIACEAPVQPTFIESLWTSMAGTRAAGAGALVEEYNCNENGARYVLKFINEPDGNWAFRHLELFQPQARASQKMNKRWRRRLKRFNTRKEKLG